MNAQLLEYRRFSSHLLAPIYSRHSLLSHWLPVQRDSFEGYVFLGSGPALLFLISAVLVLWGGYRKSEIILYIPLMIVLIGMMIYSLSDQVKVNDFILFSYKLPEFLEKYYLIFRSSGRFFWPILYGVLIFAILIVLQIKNSTVTMILLTTALLLQFYETTEIRAELRRVTNVSESVPSPISSNEGDENNFSKIFLIPSYQCSIPDTPGGFSGFSRFGMYAARRGLPVNSFYFARYNRQIRKQKCLREKALLISDDFKKDVLYVVSNDYLKQSSRIQIPDHHCFSREDSSICMPSNVEDQPESEHEDRFQVLTGERIRAVGVEMNPYLGPGWSYMENWGVWSDGLYSVLEFRKNKSSNVKRLEVTLTYRIFVDTGTGYQKFTFRPTGTAEITKQYTTAESTEITIPVLFRKNVAKIEIFTIYPASPGDLDLSEDDRYLGMGLEGITIRVDKK